MESASDTRISVLETNFSNINDDLKDIKTAINRSTGWLIVTMFTVLSSAFGVAFYIGTWKGGIEERIYTLERNQQKNINDVSVVKDSVRSIARDEINIFANRNFNSYNK